MIQTSDIRLSAAAKHAARLGPNHGYCIEGDIASLHAEIALELENDTQAQWALQLWACDAPFQGGALSGVKIAEAALPLPSQALEPQRLDAQAYASLPGGQRDYSMVLVLASGTAGAFDQIHDFANYPERQRFITPHLDGSVSYQIDGDQVVLRAERVSNPRGTDNLSGSLALELWALPDEYHGGTFSGQPLAGLAIGRIAGESSAVSIEQRVAFSVPPAGSWRVVLMLREWVKDGYVTRDYCTFAEPYVVNAPAKPAITPPEAAAVLPLPAAKNTNGQLPAHDGRVSIMRASVEELANIKGLTKKIAQEIVKARPFVSLDELVKVRGIGPKLLAKLRSQLTL
ncbi:MAG TPA: helix-hairpin-helix domain-containing protein [Polyangiales bacterium]|nr:helix-hairpin-helix domain-containing protein [Polyangiales bacterium]